MPRLRYSYLKLIICCMLVMADTSYAKNLGVYGALFPIVEQDISEFMYTRLTEMHKKGLWEKLKAQFIHNVKEHILHPSPVKGLITLEGSAQPKTFYYDPTYVVAQNITDAKGKIIVKAGTVVNPLETIKLRGVLFFLNADDKRQLAWAQQNAKNHEFVKYILVQGNIKEAGKLLQERIYFDQQGFITHKLGIHHIPCIVKQVGKKLQIQEYVLHES